MAAQTNMRDDEVMVAVEGETAFAKVIGRGSFKNSPMIKDFGHAIMSDGQSRLVIDLGHCESMDSTFMGVLAGMSLEFKERFGHPMTLVNLTEKLFALTQMLGLHHLVESFRTGEALPAYAEAIAKADPLEPLTQAETSGEEQRQMIQDAHRTLSDLSDENRLRFKDVLSYLEDAADETE